VNRSAGTPNYFHVTEFTVGEGDYAQTQKDESCRGAGDPREKRAPHKWESSRKLAIYINPGILYLYTNQIVEKIKFAALRDILDDDMQS